MKHKAGDMVRIRSRKWIDAQVTDTNGKIYPPAGYTCYFMPLMRNFCGRTAIVKSTGGYYSLDMDNGGFHWEDWMFDPDYQDDELLSVEDAIRAMLNKETLYSRDNTSKFFWDGTSFFEESNDGGTWVTIISYFNDKTFHRFSPKQGFEVEE